MGLKSGAFSRYRPRFVTFIVLLIVAAPIAVANLSHDEVPPQVPITQVSPPPNPAYGWPLIWYECEFTPASTGAAWLARMDLDLVQWSGPRLAGNVAMWCVMLAVAGVACEWLLHRYRPRIRFRPRLMTLIVFLAVAAPLMLANLSPDKRAPGPMGTWRFPSHGWPLIWRWRNQLVHGYGFVDLDQNYSTARLAGNLATWVVMLATAGLACEWLLRCYRPRLRWSLRTMLATVGLLALFCAWCTALRNRANLQDPIIISTSEYGSCDLYFERWGPQWLDLVGADRFRRLIVGADVYYSGDYDEELLASLGRLPSLRYLNLAVDQLTPLGMAAALADMQHLRTLRIASHDGVISQEYLGAVGELVRLEELHLGGTSERRSLAFLAGLTNLKSLSLQCDWYDEETLLATLPALPQLEAIDLWSFWDRGIVGDQDLRRTSVLPRLKTLNLSDADLRHLAVLPRLKSLNLSDVDVTDAGMAELASLKSLDELAIGGNTATEERLQSLSALTRLKALHIQRYSAVTETLLADLSAFEERGANQNGELLFAFDRLKKLRRHRYGSYDQSDRMTTLALDHGDAILALESEVEGLQQALDALRQSNPGIVIDSDIKWFDENRGEERQEHLWLGGGAF